MQYVIEQLGNVVKKLKIQKVSTDCATKSKGTRNERAFWHENLKSLIPMAYFSVYIVIVFCVGGCKGSTVL